MRLSVSLICLTIILTACQSQRVNIGQQDDTGDILETEQFIRAMPHKGEIQDAKHGKELWFAYGAVSGEADFPSNGVAMAHYLEDETTILSIQLNVQVADDGFFYEVWLTGPEGQQPLSLGHLTNAFGDTRHSLRFEKELDVRAYTSILITLEADDGDPAPSDQLVAKGTLKPTKR